MHRRPGAATLTILCTLLLAACGGSGSGGGGGGGGGSGVADNGGPPSSGGTDTSTMQDDPPTMPPRTPGTVLYGNWNLLIERALDADYPGCVEGCGRWFPPRPQVDDDPDDDVPPRDIPFRSPFGQMATFDPATDRWEATWSGEARGSRHVDPDEVGSGAGKAWAGTFNLLIESGELSTVKMWAENLRYRLEDDSGFSNTFVDGIPQDSTEPDTWWTATLSTEPDEKGYFSGDRLHGQFFPPSSGDTLPPSAIGHIFGAGHTGVFEVDLVVDP